jgi:hypothetical protein
VTDAKVVTDCVVKTGTVLGIYEQIVVSKLDKENTSQVLAFAIMKF